MRLPDGSIIMHGDAPYDPTKAHEYYLKTRQLKGHRPSSGSYTVRTVSGKSVRLSARQLEEQKLYAAHRVAQIKQSLNELNALMKEKLKKAKEAETKKDLPPTAAEKAKAARDSAAYKKAHKQVLQNKATAAANKNASSKSSSSTSKDTVDSLKKEIGTTKANLKAAVAKQRELATAKKNG